MSNHVFHAHLDVCEQCRNNPAFLCRVGVATLQETVEQGARKGPSLDAFFAGHVHEHKPVEPEIDPVIHERIITAAVNAQHPEPPSILELMGNAPAEVKSMRQVADAVFGKGFSTLLDL